MPIFKRIAAGLIAAILILSCADNRVADSGTSSGVDNPALTVSFVNTSGYAVRVTGDLDVYAADQNPAVDPEPLVTLKIKNSAFTNLTGNDFERLLSAASKQGSGYLNKTSAAAYGSAKGSAEGSGSGPAIVSADPAVTLFNLILRTQERTGSLAFGFKYDSIAKAFTRLGEDGAIKRFELLPKPLVRYAARVSRDPVHGDAARVFVPGSPYFATLVDSAFVLEGLPEGLFPLQLLSADGKVYPMPDSLNSLDSTLIYRPNTTPVGKIDTTGKDSIPPFKVLAGGSIQAALDLPALMEGKLIGADGADPRLSVLWRLLRDAADSGLADTLPKDTIRPKPDSGIRKAQIISPTSLRTEIRFGGEGYYEFELRATIGLRTHADTVAVSVTRRTAPKARIVQPHTGDTLVVGSTYNVQWEMPDKGLVTVRVSVDSGMKWIDLVKGYPGKSGLPIYPWTPARELGGSRKCILRVVNDADTTLSAETGLFNLLE